MLDVWITTTHRYAHLSVERSVQFFPRYGRLVSFYKLRSQIKPSTAGLARMRITTANDTRMINIQTAAFGTPKRK